MSKADLLATPGLSAAPPTASNGFIFQQTMYRIKDPKVSLDFYSRILGMRLLSKLDMPAMKFTVYFMGFESDADIPEDPKDRAEWSASRKATLELCHNWGTESDPEFTGYHNGNSDPGRGFGHIGLSVPDVYAACKWFEENGVEFVKTPDGGTMKGIAFIKDPDGYWIEILSPKGVRDFN